MAELHGLYMGVILTTDKFWDDPSGTEPNSRDQNAGLIVENPVYMEK